MSGFAEGTPTVHVTLAGKSYELAWTWGAKRRLRDHLAKLGTDMGDKIAIAENIPAVLWASMDKESRGTISVEDVEELIHAGNEAQVSEKIGELVTMSEPKPDVKAEPAAVKEPTAGRSTSKRSGPLESTTSV